MEIVGIAIVMVMLLLHISGLGLKSLLALLIRNLKVYVPSVKPVTV